MADPVSAALVFSTILSAGSQVGQGMQAENSAKYQAQALETAGTQDLAASQRRAYQERRQAGFVGSRARAVAAASGAGATDPTVLDIEGNIAAQGEYNALSALYEGQEAKRSADTQGALYRYEGAAAKNAAYTKAATTLLSGGTSLYDKYGKPERPKIPNDYQGHGYTSFGYG